MSGNGAILLDLTRWVKSRLYGGPATGIDRVCDAYVEHFGARCFGVLQFGSLHRVLDMSRTQNLLAAFSSSTKRQTAYRLLAKTLSRRNAPSNLSGVPYLNVGHSGFDRASHWAWVRQWDVQPHYFVHDLIPILHPEFTTPHKTRRHQGRVMGVLQNQAAIIVNSHSTYKDVHSFAASQGIALSKVCVAPLGIRQAGQSWRPVSDHNTFVAVGTIEARKNYAFLLRIWLRLIDAYGRRAPRLTIVGKWGVKSDDVRRILRLNPTLREYVSIRTDACDQTLAEILAQARAVVLPSKAEGFGLPLAEALQMGVPVIASDIPSHRAVGEGHATLLDPQGQEGWYAAICSLCNAPADMARRPSPSPRFTAPLWSAHFAAVEHWISQHGQPPAQPSSCDISGRDNDKPQSVISTASR